MIPLSVSQAHQTMLFPLLLYRTILFSVSQAQQTAVPQLALPPV